VSHPSKSLATSDHAEVQIATLTEVLDKAIAAMWPKRAQQELLLDLGEHKYWTPIARHESLDEAANWLVCQLGLPSFFDVVPEQTQSVADVDEDARQLARELGAKVALGERMPGVAAWACHIAPALGTTAKTLANNLKVPLRSDRSDHRWLRFLSAATRGQTDTPAWFYHRRCAQTVADALGAMCARIGCLHAGDAVLVLSLLAQWHHLRDPAEVRSNRGRPRSRRETPKPIAGIIGQVVQPGQVPSLVRLARQAGLGGPSIVRLAIEAALVEGHLGPHPVRAVGDKSSPKDRGQSWLAAAESALKEAGDTISQEDVSVFVFRIERHRAWLAKKQQQEPDVKLLALPYVAASMALERRHWNPNGPLELFNTDEKGLLMLLPYLRPKGMLKEP
jgi:hypothetical protein